MKLTITNSLYIAGTILLGSAIISQFEKAELITSTVLVIVSMVLLFFGYRKDREKVSCAIKNRKSKKLFGLGLGVAILFLAMGFAIGKLIYLWSQV